MLLHDSIKSRMIPIPIVRFLRNKKGVLKKDVICHVRGVVYPEKRSLKAEGELQETQSLQHFLIRECLVFVQDEELMITLVEEKKIRSFFFEIEEKEYLMVNYIKTGIDYVRIRLERPRSGFSR